MWQQAGRHGVGAVVKNLHLRPQAQGRERRERKGGRGKEGRWWGEGREVDGEIFSGYWEWFRLLKP